MNGCEHYQELISRMIDGELSEEEKTELKAHLDCCEDCATLYKVFENLSNTIQEDVVDPPDEFCEEIMARLRREDIRRKNFAPWKKLIAAAACLAVILLAGAAIYPTLPNRVSALTATPAIQKSTAVDSAAESSAAAGSAVMTEAPASPAKDEASAQSSEQAAQKSAAEQAKSSTASAGEAAAKSQESAGTAKESPAAAPQESAAATDQGSTVEILIPQDEPKSTDEYASQAAGETEAAPAEVAAAEEEAAMIEADIATMEAEDAAVYAEENSLMLAAAAPPESVELNNYKRWTQLGVLLGVEEDKAVSDAKAEVNAKAESDAKVDIDVKNKVSVKSKAAAKDEVVATDEDEFDLDGVFPDAVYELSCLKRKDLKMTVYVYGEKLYYRIEKVEDEDASAAGKAAVPSHAPVASPDVEEEEAEEPLILAKCTATDFVKFIEAK